MTRATPVSATAPTSTASTSLYGTCPDRRREKATVRKPRPKNSMHRTPNTSTVYETSPYRRHTRTSPGQAGNFGEELLEVERLGEVSGGPGGLGACQEVLLAIAGQNEHGSGRPQLTPKVSEEIEAAPVRHEHVED